MGLGCIECFRRFMQLILVIVNLIVALLGIAVLIIGIWAEVEQKKYFEIADSSTKFLEVPVLLIIVGLFVAIVGVIGAIGGVFASKTFGRVILGLYAFILGLLVICEIAGGIAAGVKRNDVFDSFRSSSLVTFKKIPNDTSYNQTWNDFQKGFKCCGVDNYTDYRTILNIDVPYSCCNGSESQCDTANPSNVWPKGCVTTVVDDIKDNYVSISVGAIIFALLQVIGIVVACFVAIYKQEDNKYEVV